MASPSGGRCSCTSNQTTRTTLDRRGLVYIRVSDAEALHAEWTSAGVEGRFMGPHNTPYGLREFVYTDPDGIVHKVGARRFDQGSPRSESGDRSVPQTRNEGHSKAPKLEMVRLSPANRGAATTAAERRSAGADMF